MRITVCLFKREKNSTPEVGFVGVSNPKRGVDWIVDSEGCKLPSVWWFEIYWDQGCFPVSSDYLQWECYDND